MTFTSEELTARQQAVAADPGHNRRGVREALTEARRQAGFGEWGLALYWQECAEARAELLTRQEWDARITARQENSR